MHPNVPKFVPKIARFQAQSGQVGLQKVSRLQAPGLKTMGFLTIYNYERW
jgi:hypothetical protein